VPEVPEHRIELGVGGEFVLVWQKGRIESVAQARAFQARIEAAVAQAGVRKALFDNRETDVPSDDVRDCMFGWVTTPGRFTAVALLLTSEMLAVRVNMSALSLRVKMRAFDSRAKAEEWLARAG
jgi:hypothetical protein